MMLKIGINDLRCSCIHAPKWQFASVTPHVRMKIFSCQQIPQGEWGSFCLPLLVVSLHSIRNKKEKNATLLHRFSSALQSKHVF